MHQTRGKTRRAKKGTSTSGINRLGRSEPPPLPRQSAKDDITLIDTEARTAVRSMAKTVETHNARLGRSDSHLRAMNLKSRNMDTALQAISRKNLGLQKAVKKLQDVVAQMNEERALLTTRLSALEIAFAESDEEEEDEEEEDDVAAAEDKSEDGASADDASSDAGSYDDSDSDSEVEPTIISIDEVIGE